MAGVIDELFCEGEIIFEVGSGKSKQLLYTLNIINLRLCGKDTQILIYCHINSKSLFDFPIC